MSAVRIIYWWDRHSRNWIVQALDTEGNQIGSAYYAANRRTLDGELEAMHSLHPGVPVFRVGQTTAAVLCQSARP